ncbi:MAG: hypothetical protein HOI88_04695 [Phycisphaerae bacterium]|nr:hypothetical protein [Phycisphaerae bacterium]MBT5364950.1 hypothetical protein [Phycisphaerae bacterium]MBT6269628.1 hypothetical protein [Phycisphaerae bacterium]
MPPKGGNPMLNDAGIMNIIAYLHTLTVPTENGEVHDAVANSDTSADVSPTETEAPESFIATLPKSTVPKAMQAPSGLAPEEASEAQRMAVFEKKVAPQLDINRPANAHLFFGLYFLMTGLHGIHVVIGMIVLLWLMWRLKRGDFNKRYYSAVECGGLYWHVVDVIWIFLFPLWYLLT